MLSHPLRSPLPVLLGWIALSSAASCASHAELVPSEPVPGVAPKTLVQREALRSLSPLPTLAPDPTNAVADDPRARALGKQLFFDAGFSGPLRVRSDLGAAGEVGKVSCASCHLGPALDDRRSVPGTVSIGTDVHTRNSPPLVNSAYYRWTNWGGRFSAQWELPPAVAESPLLFNGNRLSLAHRIFDVYRGRYEAIFGPLDPALADTARFPAAGKPKPAPSASNPTPQDGDWEAMAETDRQLVNQVFVNYGKLVTAYVRTLISTDSAFDRFVAGDDDALSPAAQRGAALFIGDAGCVTCHATPTFSDDDFHNLGVPQVGPSVPPSDDGRFRDVPPLLASSLNASGRYSDDPSAGRIEGLTDPMPELTRGAFRTPSLRNVALTAPYMHSGQLATLRDVVNFYAAGGGTPTAGSRDPVLAPLGLSDAQKDDLVAFLESLTLDPLPSELSTPETR